MEPDEALDTLGEHNLAFSGQAGKVTPCLAVLTQTRSENGSATPSLRWACRNLGLHRLGG